MLSIAKLKSAAQAMTYYEMDDYYTKGGGDPEAQGSWFGNGAAALGLAGAVEPGTFKSLLEGALPNGRLLGTDSEDQRKHTPGWDLTFSAPKSVSILIEVGGDRDLLSAHDRAVKEALHWVEEHSIGTRVRSQALGRLFVRTDSMAAALFNHHTSRNQDPETHTHTVVLNATETEPGEWRSLQSHVLFKNKMAIGAIYRAALAREAQALGYQVDVTHRDGRFEIAAVPPELIEKFSSRRKEVEAYLKERGWSGAAASELAAQRSRTPKRAVDHRVLEKQWRETAAGMNIDAGQLVKNAKAAGSQTSVEGVNLDTALKEAISVLSEGEAVFTHANLVRQTLAGAMGRADVKAVEGIIKQFEKDLRLHRVDDAGLELWTTPRAREQERRIIESILKTQGTRAPIAGSEGLQAAFDADNLNAKQRVAAEVLLTSPDGFTAVVGVPGAGKTRMLKTVRKVAESHGRKLVGMAQTKRAAETLEKESGIVSSTINKHLYRVGRDVAALVGASREEARKIRRKYAKQVWVIDEASLLPNALQRQLANAALKLSVQVILGGDPNQINAIEAGQPFALQLKNGIRYAELDEIVRTGNEGYKSAVLDVRKSRIRGALRHLDSSTQEIEDGQERIAAMLSTFKGLNDNERANSLLLTARNAEKDILNAGVRNILIEEGKLTDAAPREKLVSVMSRSAERKDARFYETGWVLLFNADVPELGISKGEYWRVDGVDRKRNNVTLERADDQSGRKLQWNPREFGTSGRRSFKIFGRSESSLAIGDVVRWTHNTQTKQYKLFNGQMLKVVAMDNQSTTFLTETKQKITVDQRSFAGAHWDHAYAMTIYSSQGMTVDLVIANADSKQADLSQKTFLVAISRQRHKLWLFTDSKDDLRDMLESALGDKTSAKEAMERAAAVRAEGITGHISNARRQEIRINQQSADPTGAKRSTEEATAGQPDDITWHREYAWRPQAQPSAPYSEILINSRPVNRDAATRAAQMSRQLLSDWSPPGAGAPRSPPSQTIGS